MSTSSRGRARASTATSTARRPRRCRSSGSERSRRQQQPLGSLPVGPGRRRDQPRDERLQRRGRRPVRQLSVDVPSVRQAARERVPGGVRLRRGGADARGLELHIRQDGRLERRVDAKRRRAMRAYSSWSSRRRTAGPTGPRAGATPIRTRRSTRRWRPSSRPRCAAPSGGDPPCPLSRRFANECCVSSVKLDGGRGAVRALPSVPERRMFASRGHHGFHLSSAWSTHTTAERSRRSILC